MGKDDPDDNPNTYEEPNPDYEALETLKKDISGARETLESSLKRPATTMGDGSAWTGPTAAKNFTQEISGRADRIPGLVNGMISAVEAEMAHTPKTITRIVGGGHRPEMI